MSSIPLSIGCGSEVMTRNRAAAMLRTRRFYETNMRRLRSELQGHVMDARHSRFRRRRSFPVEGANSFEQSSGFLEQVPRSQQRP